MNYAVIVNMPGYLPDSEPEIYRNVTDARNGAQWHAEQFREDGYTVKGNKKDGYAVYRRRAAYVSFYISITETDEEPEE